MEEKIDEEQKLNLLNYEKNICMEMMAEDALVVLGKGMSHSRLIATLVHLYSHPSCLVLIINCNPKQELFIRNQVKNLNLPCEVKLLRDIPNGNKRETLYYSGGVFFVPSQMIIHDMLIRRIPTEKITGMIISKAHKVDSCSKEAFVIRLYREMNNNGFLKAISDHPTSFFDGFSKIDKVLHNLMINKLLLYPRFHMTVQQSLGKHSIDVSEIDMHMDSSTTLLQSAIFELLGICLKDLKTHIKIPLDTSMNMFDIQTYLTYHHILLFKMIFDPIWHLLNIRSKTLLCDIRFLCELLEDLIKLDCVTFYHKLYTFQQELHIDRIDYGEMFVNSMGRSSFKPTSSYWLLAEPSSIVFDESYRRVILFMNSLMSSQLLHSGNYDWLMYLNPKWYIALKVYQSICQENPNASILVLMKNEFGLTQLENLFCNPLSIMKRYGLFAINQKLASQARIDKLNKTQVGTKLEIPTSIALKHFYRTIDTLNTECTADKNSSNCCYTIIQYDDNVDIEQQMKDNYFPTNIIVYDLQLNVVRQLETYRNIHYENDFVVHMIHPNDSVDEKKYKIDIKTENEAFKMLIEYKSLMPVNKCNTSEIIYHDHLADNNGSVSTELVTPSIQIKSANIITDMRPSQTTTKSSSIYQNTTNNIHMAPSKIVIDLREFNSKLPFLIHKTGLKIIPKQLEIADYIVALDTAIERKSLTDLVASLDDGRLYTQARNLTKNFSRPILLIEFDNNKSSKCLRNKMFRSINNFVIQTKIIKMVLNFPQLLVQWSLSPIMSVDLFLTLKTNRPDPIESEYLDCEFGAYTAEDKMNLSKKKASTELKEMICRLSMATRSQIIPKNSPVPISLYDLVNYDIEEMTHFLTNHNWAMNVCAFFKHNNSDL